MILTIFLKIRTKKTEIVVSLVVLVEDSLFLLVVLLQEGAKLLFPFFIDVGDRIVLLTNIYSVAYTHCYLVTTNYLLSK